MTDIKVLNKIIHWSIKRGVGATITLRKPGGWAMYSLIQMDVKEQKSLEAKAVFSLSVGDGFTIDGEALSITLSQERTRKLRAKKYPTDLKMMEDDRVLPPLEFLFDVTETVTNI